VSGDDAKRVAKHALDTGMADSALARDRGHLLDPLRIRSPGGAPAGWVVPIGLGDALLGFIQLRDDGAFHRYASFQRNPTTAAGCPPIATWLDEATVLARARAFARPDEALDSPTLAYDHSPDRVAWAVRATSPDGARRIVFVAGTAVWAASETNS